MNYRPLGSSGILVSELGFGTWGIGGATEGASSYGQTDDRESIRALETAFDQGINFFDTATAYGRSEELLGQTFSGSKRDKVVIATKVGITQHFGPQDFSEQAITRTLVNSLKRLRTNYIDLLQLYNPPLMSMPLDDILEILSRLRDGGLIRAYGASLKSPLRKITPASLTTTSRSTSNSSSKVFWLLLFCQRSGFLKYSFLNVSKWEPWRTKSP